MRGGRSGHSHRYIKTLQALGMVERRDPVLADAGGRHGRYHVSDPFLQFYYRFLLPHRTTIAREVLVDLSERSQRMPQVAEGRATQIALLARAGFTDATQALAREQRVRLMSLEDIERTLISAAQHLSIREPRGERRRFTHSGRG